MARRVVSVIGRRGSVLRAGDAALEANAFAVAEDVELVLVLRGDGVELALKGEVAAGAIAGVSLPPVAVGQDLRGLLESGVAVHADSAALAGRGLGPDDLISGVHVVDADALATLLGDAEAVLSW